MATVTSQVGMIELEWIVRDPEIQAREGLNQDAVAQYAEDMAAGIEFPAVVVYYDLDADRYWLSQGFHRCEAAEAAGLDIIRAEVRGGTREDALWDAAGSNREHDKSGLRRTNKDKRRAVRMAIVARPKQSDTKIAQQVGVSPPTVASVRAIYKDFIDTSEREVTRNGATYTMQTNGIGRRTLEEVQEDEDGAVEPDGDEPAELFQLIPPSIAAEVEPARKASFNRTNDNVEWALWTWNPVTGCEHNCVYCYARDIANRFYPEKFKPTFHPERLNAPRHMKVPAAAAENVGEKNVFVCSMADLFGRWVPDEWIDAVMDEVRAAPQWNFLFLTKFPLRYEGIDFPDNAWVGTSVDEQKRVASAEKAFRNVKAKVKWLSCEPLRERLTFSSLEMFDWVVMGGQSASSGAPAFQPPWDWVEHLWWQAREAGCQVYWKPNLETRPREYPGQQPTD